MVNIIGNGLAGLSAAITLAKSNVRSRLISTQPSYRAQSVLAEGGINAALDTMGECDSVKLHFEETMKSGGYLADEEAVRGLTLCAPQIVKSLYDLGVAFEHDGDKIMLRSFGGQSKRRTAYVKSSTGKAIMTALIDKVREYECAGLIERLSHHEFVSLCIEDDHVYAVRVRDIYSDSIYELSGITILASGGLTGFFPGLCTGSVANTGDVTAIAYDQGVEVDNLEMIQYHPTTIAISGKRCLISEAARGEGGRLFVDKGGKPWYFMEEMYPEFGNLMPRDVVSRTIAMVTKDDECSDTVYLDMRNINANVWDGRLSDMRDEIIKYTCLDPATNPIPVSPGIHYFMGGIKVDKKHRTSLSGLYAAGECACQYHGANRLGGNSLLGAIYGGYISANDIVSHKSDGDAYDKATSYEADKEIADPYAKCVRSGFDKMIGDILKDGMGVLRSEEGISDAIERLEKIYTGDFNKRERARYALAKKMLYSALNRKESLGAHYRIDQSVGDIYGSSI